MPAEWEGGRKGEREERWSRGGERKVREAGKGGRWEARKEREWDGGR